MLIPFKNKIKGYSDQEKNINLFFIGILLISILRLFLNYFILNSEEIIINIFCIQVTAFCFLFYFLEYKYKKNPYLIGISLFFQFCFISLLLYINKSHYLGLELYIYPLIAALFLFLNVFKYKKIITLCLISVIIIIVFILKINLNYENTNQKDKFTYNINLFFSYFSTFFIIYLIHNKHFILLSENKLKIYYNINKIDNMKKIMDSDIESLVNISRTDIKNFKRKFNKIYPDFLKNLIAIHKNLSTSEQILCMLIFLKLSNKEISSILDIEYRSVIMKKYNLRKKINIQQELTLDEYILKI